MGSTPFEVTFFALIKLKKNLDGLFKDLLIKPNLPTVLFTQLLLISDLNRRLLLIPLLINYKSQPGFDI